MVLEMVVVRCCSLIVLDYGLAYCGTAVELSIDACSEVGIGLLLAKLVIHLIDLRLQIITPHRQHNMTTHNSRRTSIDPINPGLTAQPYRLQLQTAPILPPINQFHLTWLGLIVVTHQFFSLLRLLFAGQMVFDLFMAFPGRCIIHIYH